LHDVFFHVDLNFSTITKKVSNKENLYTIHQIEILYSLFIAPFEEPYISSASKRDI